MKTIVNITLTLIITLAPFNTFSFDGDADGYEDGIKTCPLEELKCLEGEITTDADTETYPTIYEQIIIDANLSVEAVYIKSGQTSRRKNVNSEADYKEWKCTVKDGNAERVTFNYTRDVALAKVRRPFRTEEITLIDFSTSCDYKDDNTVSKCFESSYEWK